MTNPQSNIQTKIDMRQQAMDRVQSKIDSIDEQIAVMKNARARYVEDLAKKQAGLDALVELRDSVEGNAERIETLRLRNLEILASYPDPTPHTPEDQQSYNDPELLANNEEMDRLAQRATYADIEKQANKIYYGKA